MVEIKFAFGAANASMATRGVEAVSAEVVVDETKSLLGSNGYVATELGREQVAELTHCMDDCKIHCAASKIADKEWKMRSGD